MSASLIQLIASIIFAVAILHTFSVKFFKKLAHKYPRHEKIFDMLGEVEIVFGFWAIALILIFFSLSGKNETLSYLNNQSYVEPIFVFVIMIIAASKPVLDFSLTSVRAISRLLPIHKSLSLFFITISFVPLLGSFITEPAAMTLGALLLKDHFYSKNISNKLKYAIIGTLFVNVSIGGTLTPFAAPPILMVASKWNWDLTFMITTFGWRTALAVFTNSLILTLIFKKELANLEEPNIKPSEVVLGGLQKWWLQPLLNQLTPDQIYYAATALTAITDNAALTYLGSLVDGLSDQFKYALAAGAVTGGGLTVIANAPNPAGYSILNKNFENNIISPLYLFLSALGPTIVAIFFYKFI